MYVQPNTHLKAPGSTDAIRQESAPVIRQHQVLEKLPGSHPVDELRPLSALNRSIGRGAAQNVLGGLRIYVEI